MCHLLLAGYEDVSSFLNQLKLIVQPDIVVWKQMTGAQAPSILASQSTEMYVSRRNALVTIKDILVDTLVPERCVIFCWHVMKMFRLFLTG